jgi:sialate O-acetylesterase
MVRPLLADVVLPSTHFSSGMILQQGMAVPIWGVADRGESIEVNFRGQIKTTTADAQGRWIVWLDPMPASSTGAPMRISGRNEIVLDDVLVGEV